jgi:ATP-dependent DNA helicase RecG
VTPEFIREHVATGRLIIPANVRHLAGSAGQCAATERRSDEATEGGNRGIKGSRNQGVQQPRQTLNRQSSIVNRQPPIPNPQSSIPNPQSIRLVSAKQAYDRLTQGPWRGLNVGLLHGSLKPAEKQETVEAFVEGKFHAVVATTVVEVGVDVANATIMIVENADRFGLSQLHQLRGRVGRGSKDSLCVLIAHGRGEKAAERLEVMAQTTDGFKIAEADLRQRGPGELFGTRQHGLPELRVGDILNDFSLLEQARQDAFDVVARDPKLEQPPHARMIPALRKMFGTRLALIDAG